MIDDDKQRLQHIVQTYAALCGEVEGYKDSIRGCADEQKELATAASERLGLDAKALKQLVAEFRMGAEDRDLIRQREAKLDECRHALGLLADTPLGQAAMTPPATKRGRPKGSRNKPRDNGNGHHEAPRTAVDISAPPMDPFTAGGPPPIPEWSN
jgi:hypothetical protein